MLVVVSIALVYLIVIGLWGLVAFGKLLQMLNAINQTLREIKVAVQQERNPSRD